MAYETRDINHAKFLSHRGFDLHREPDPLNPCKYVFVFPLLDMAEASDLLVRFYIPACPTCRNCPHTLLAQRVLPRGVR